MHWVDVAGYKRFRASELRREEQERLNSVIQYDLVEALISQISTEPVDIDLAEIELVLRPGQDITDWTVEKDCGTCATCHTCATCGTGCPNNYKNRPDAIPLSVARQLGVDPWVVQEWDIKRLKESIDLIIVSLEEMER